MCNDLLFKNLTNESVFKELSDLKKQLDDGTFDYEINTTAIQYFNYINNRFTDDQQITNLIQFIMNKFLLWYSSNKSDNYIPTHGSEPMYSLSHLQQVFNISIPSKS